MKSAWTHSRAQSKAEDHAPIPPVKPWKDILQVCVNSSLHFHKTPALPANMKTFRPFPGLNPKFGEQRARDEDEGHIDQCL